MTAFRMAMKRALSEVVTESIVKQNRLATMEFRMVMKQTSIVEEVTVQIARPVMMVSRMAMKKESIAAGVTAQIVLNQHVMMVSKMEMKQVLIVVVLAMRVLIQAAEKAYGHRMETSSIIPQAM